MPVEVSTYTVTLLSALPFAVSRDVRRTADSSLRDSLVRAAFTVSFNCSMTPASIIAGIPAGLYAFVRVTPAAFLVRVGGQQLPVAGSGTRVGAGDSVVVAVQFERDGDPTLWGTGGDRPVDCLRRELAVERGGDRADEEGRFSGPVDADADAERKPGDVDRLGVAVRPEAFNFNGLYLHDRYIRGT